MFTRVLTGWAMDLLHLRRSGLITPSARVGLTDFVYPASLGHHHVPRWQADVASSLRWRPGRHAA